MREKIARFLYGRYGNDQLNNFLVGVAFLVIIINVFINSYILVVVNYLVLALAIFRMLSKKYQKRRNELNRFLKLSRPYRNIWNKVKLRIADRNNKYYRCPSCNQLVRVPKKRGKIVITCPRCQNKFEKRT